MLGFMWAEWIFTSARQQALEDWMNVSKGVGEGRKERYKGAIHAKPNTAYDLHFDAHTNCSPHQPSNLKDLTTDSVDPYWAMRW